MPLTIRSCWFESLANSSIGILVDSSCDLEKMNGRWVSENIIDNLQNHINMNYHSKDPFNCDAAVEDRKKAMTLHSLLEILPILKILKNLITLTELGSKALLNSSIWDFFG